MRIRDNHYFSQKTMFWRKNCFGVLFLIGIFLFLEATTLFSFPAKRRLFELKYGYKTVCNQCHVDGGGSENNDYGIDFHRKGQNLAAFSKIEVLDSDGDAFSNLEEIKAKSNPGDPRSTPKKPGNYMQDRAETFIPKNNLQKLFPKALKFRAVEGIITPGKKKEYEQKVGLILGEDEQVPTFFEAYSNTQQKLGVALLFASMEHHKHTFGGVACDTSGKVLKVIIFKQQERKNLKMDSFLKQFEKKSTGNQFKVGKDMQPLPKLEVFSQKISDFVKKSVWIIKEIYLTSEKQKR